MTETGSVRVEFVISVTDVTVRSATDVLDGKVPTVITFHIEPLGKEGSPCDLKLDLIGENLNRALRLQKSGASSVEVGFDWWMQHCLSWQRDVVDLALRQLETVSRGR